MHRGRALASERQGFRPSVGGALYRFVTHVDEPLVALAARGRIDFDAPQTAVVIEQRQLVGDLTNAEGELLRVGNHSVGGNAERESVKLGRAVAVGPPQARMRESQ